ncbi:MAG: hypothetical protein WD826_11500, partial [Actinomycetota bacterium]
LSEIDHVLARMDPDRSPVEKVGSHFQRYLPLYAFASVIALIAVLIPLRRDDDTAKTQEAAAITSTEVDDAFASSTGETSEAADDAGTSAAGANTGTVAAPIDQGGSDVGKIVAGTGKTIAGFDCKTGVRQMPWSDYANPCIAHFTGNNGGKTFRGVDEKTIRIGIRQPAVDAGDVTDTQARAEGSATREEGIALFKKYAKYFETVFDLYGRKIQFVDFKSRVSNGIEEAQSRGEEGACADATDLAETHKVFGVVGYNAALQETQPFADCATERKMFVPFGSPYFPESWYQKKWHPYVWNLTQECERISKDVAEYTGKRLLNRPAKWALDPIYQKQERVFGTYVPDNDGYQSCVDLFEKTLEKDYGGKVKHRFDYVLDVARFPDQARQATIQFQAAGVNSLINACDTLSTRFLSESADDINWGPEWFIIGVAGQDTDGAARTFDQDIVDGHMFGMSQAGEYGKIEGKSGESYETWTKAFKGQAPARGYGSVYYFSLAFFMMLQAAGPLLTPDNIAKGLTAMPDGGGANGPLGTWSFADDHTAIDDAREIYWIANKRGSDGSLGAYIETYNGKRFRTGQWPKEEPPVYR